MSSSLLSEYYGNSLDCKINFFIMKDFFSSFCFLKKTLDFGNPTLLTEIFFEMNPQVSQLNLDIWTKSECEDGKRV